MFDSHLFSNCLHQQSHVMQFSCLINHRSIHSHRVYHVVPPLTPPLCSLHPLSCCSITIKNACSHLTHVIHATYNVYTCIDLGVHIYKEVLIRLNIFRYTRFTDEMWNSFYLVYASFIFPRAAKLITLK